MGPVESPKSDAFPADAIVIKSIVLFPVGEDPSFPIKMIPLVLLELPEAPLLATFKSPKSCVFPVVAIVRKSILL